MSPIASEKPLGFRNTARIERNAGRIDDPIERLKYLRKVTATPAPIRLNWARLIPFCLVLVLLSLRSDARFRRPSDARQTVNAILLGQQAIPNVWRVEATKDYEVFSNGLRIENVLAVSNQPRSYRLLSVDDPSRPSRLPLDPAPLPVGSPRPVSKPQIASMLPYREGSADDDQGRSPSIPRTQPAGIVFHTTESDQAPFEAAQQHNLQRITKDTLLFVRQKRAYHFLIDRFGRVHRIVVESDSANHAGNSVWADSRWLYLDLNESFLGVAFEASMQTDQPPINEAQVHAAKVLTEMLRSKYNIPARNCVTHAQVSVNPDNRRIGWHSDWGRGFPFAEVGLPDNYEQPLPSLFLMGFEYDNVYVNATGPGIWRSLAAAEDRLREAADARGRTVAEYRTLLQKRYSDEIRALRQRGQDQEN